MTDRKSWKSSQRWKNIDTCVCFFFFINKHLKVRGEWDGINIIIRNKSSAVERVIIRNSVVLLWSAWPLWLPAATAKAVKRNRMNWRLKQSSRPKINPKAHFFYRLPEDSQVFKSLLCCFCCREDIENGSLRYLHKQKNLMSIMSPDAHNVAEIKVTAVSVPDNWIALKHADYFIFRTSFKRRWSSHLKRFVQ